MKAKNLHSRTLPGKAVIQIWRRDQKFNRKAGVKTVYNHKPSFMGKVKLNSRSGKKVTTRNMKITKGKFSSVEENK